MSLEIVHQRKLIGISTTLVATRNILSWNPSTIYFYTIWLSNLMHDHQFNPLQKMPSIMHFNEIDYNP